jgi:Asp-tRNA(Asn)/Glu-tRNA(Gln) amidotransferase A subunit family amidase
MTGARWRVRGDPLVAPTASGLLDGLTVAVKDIFAVRGHATGAGNPTWLAEAAPAVDHAAAVRTLLDAGAAVAGIAQTDEFAYSLAGTNAHYGPPPNPAAPDRIPGGSSNGPASAVAAGEADIGLGSDTAGSARVPASYQGLVGLRPTYGVLDRTGMLPLAPSFDTVGWLVRDAATLAAVADVALPPGRDDVLRHGVVVPALNDVADPPVGAAVSAGVAALLETGVVDDVETVAVDPDLPERAAAAFRVVQAFEAWAADGAWVDAHPGAVGPDVAARFDVARRVSPDEADDARAALAVAIAPIRALLMPGTVLFLPAASSVAPRRGPAGGAELEAARAATVPLTCPAPAIGAPAVSLPLAGVDGLPVGVAAMAAPHADRALVELARRIA